MMMENNMNNVKFIPLESHLISLIQNTHQYSTPFDILVKSKNGSLELMKATSIFHDSTATRKPSTVGDILLYEYLEPSGLKINDLAEILNVHRNSASALINNNRKLSTDMAFRLAKAFETSAKFWLNIQLAVDLWHQKNDWGGVQGE